MRPNQKSDYLALAITLLACLLILVFFLSRIVQAHEAPTGWAYDPICCGGNDCFPITGVLEIDGKYFYTTKLGSKPITPQTMIKRSKDGLTHACIYQDRLHCIYLPDSG